ncbi:winged helix-turn-helix transcriptional regulator [Cohnella nanjingensis]|uniref:Helix-turn-helix transcriptional regulator n=1 Tax=Cohnella nanjingensis TaxID=1387779 RepID=A0A7X0RTY9_9BACL|nr:helix-turn-helix domain-containing protein [Cohnella nanjingensis]MBB6673668.1 helix-turn-helix transcriptional regulator [Cohnella nanjingensis]
MAKMCECLFPKKQEEVWPLIVTQNVLTGRWKLAILWFLNRETRRFSEIKSFLNDISQGSLTKQLREMEDHALILRFVYPEVPPRVEYSLTSRGRSLIPIIELMAEWGKLS